MATPKPTTLQIRSRKLMARMAKNPAVANAVAGVVAVDVVGRTTTVKTRRRLRRLKQALKPQNLLMKRQTPLRRRKHRLRRRLQNLRQQQRRLLSHRLSQRPQNLSLNQNLLQQQPKPRPSVRQNPRSPLARQNLVGGAVSALNLAPATRGLSHDRPHVPANPWPNQHSG
jgi:hypothetical protein